MGGLQKKDACVASGAGERQPIEQSAPVICERFDNLGFDDPSHAYRLGIMGGTFDPIHIGHLACAEQVREACDLDAVVFMPAGDPWMKRGRRLASAEDRFAMVCLAAQDNPHFGVSRLEIDRSGETYTVDTLRALKAHYPENVELFFISGADAVFRILEWRDAQEVASLARLVAVTRPGYEISDARSKYMRTHASIMHISQLEVTALSISSTDLREKVRAGKSIRYLVPQVVADYIQEHGLYR